MGETAFITGANGEVGHAILPFLAKSKIKVIALDIADIDPSLTEFVSTYHKTNILDKAALGKIFSENKIDTIFHFGALLSTAAEKDPDLAQSVNTQGTANLLSVANQSCLREDRPIKFIFPSTIAVYGLPDLKTKMLETVS